MAKQFAEFDGDDGVDHRREVMRLLAELGRGWPPAIGDHRRANFLRSLIPASEACFAHLPCMIAPCDVVTAYGLFVAITGVLGVPIQKAAKDLEKFGRRKVMVG